MKKKPMKLTVLKRELKEKLGAKYDMVQRCKTTNQIKFNPPTRELGLVNTVGFAFKSHRNVGELSYMGWPKAKDLTGTIEEFVINSDDFNTATTYTLVE